MLKAFKHVRQCTRQFSTQRGDKLHGYTVKSVEEVPELSLTAIELTHDKTGAKHCHIARDDANNSFNVAFATTPQDDSGVAHILEHTVLCGSEKFPCRDPFFKMLTRSLSTFMNAFTGPDFTMYPFSTQNTKDYYNLLSVYSDAVFHPNLTQLDFLQEGWRLEQSELDNAQSDLQLKGVVFNEMKGYNNNSGYFYGQGVLNNLLPSNTYKNCSGGDPLAIPSLSHDQLREFHKSHYHPSNAIFYTYGNMPLEQHLEYINGVLAAFEPIIPNTAVPSEHSWNTPQRLTIPGPPDSGAGDADRIVGVSYKLCTINDRYMSTVLSILSNILTEGPQSLFYQELIGAELGADFAPGTGLSAYSKDIYFTVGLKGVKEGNVEAVLEAIERVWSSVAEGGLDQGQLAAILHQEEISRKHQTTSFGLHLGVGVLGAWLHGSAPSSYLQFSQHLEKLKEAPEGYLEGVVKEWFIDNQHRLTLVQVPDEDFAKGLEDKEAVLLESMVKDVTDETRAVLQEQGQMLREQQDTQQDVSCLPCIKLEDIPATGEHYPTEQLTIEGVPLQIYTGPTNGLTYFRCLSTDLDLAPVQEALLPFYCSVLTSVGCGDMSYQQVGLQQMLRTGSLSCSPHTVADKHKLDTFSLASLLSSHSLDANLPYMFNLLEDMSSEPNFKETERVKAILDMQVAALQDSIVSSGHGYAMARARSHISPLGRLSETLGGFSQARTLQTLQKGNVEELVSELAGLHVLLFDRSQLKVSVNTGLETLDETLDALSPFLSSTSSGGGYGIYPHDFVAVGSSNEFVEVPGLGVNFCARAYRGVPACSPDSPKLRLAAALMSSKFLHKEIREKGGAYGSGAMVGSHCFSMMSYRDPHNFTTLETFDAALQWTKVGSFTAQDLEEAKISILSKIDAPTAPGSRGVGEFLGGFTKEEAQAYREGILSGTREDVIDVTDRYLVDNHIVSNVVVGSSSLVKDFEKAGFSLHHFGGD